LIYQAIQVKIWHRGAMAVQQKTILTSTIQPLEP
jgi:hypothetical protein